VLGHNECGGIKGAIDDVKLGNLTAMLAKIRPAVAATRFEGDRTTKNHAFVQAVAETNARLTAQKLTRDSKVIRELVEAKQLRIAAAMHDISTGKVTFLA
jgi:carbonic anhydrase